MITEDINLELIVKILEVLPNSQEYSTKEIEIARGKWKYKPSILQHIKNLFRCQR